MAPLLTPIKTSAFGTNESPINQDNLTQYKTYDQCKVVSNELQAVATSVHSYAIDDTSTWPNAQYAQCKIVKLGGETTTGAGLMLRVDSTNDRSYVFIVASDGSVHGYRQSTTTLTSFFTSTTSPFVANDTIRVEVREGTSQSTDYHYLDVYRNGTFLETAGSTNLDRTAGDSGLYVYSTNLTGNSIADDWVAGSIDAQLSDTGMLVRYHFDEESSGSAATDVIDYGGGTAMNLTTAGFNSGTDGGWGETSSGHRFLESKNTLTAMRATHQLTAGDKIVSASGGKAYTIEFVADSTTGHDNGCRSACVQHKSNGNSPVLGMTFRGSSPYWNAYWENAQHDTTGTAHTGIHTFHVVYNSAEANDMDVIKVYVDGVEWDMSDTSAFTNDDTCLIDTNDMFVIFNRLSGSWNRSPVMKMYYAAMYNHAMTASECFDAHALLLTRTDQPVAGGGGITTLNRRTFRGQSRGIMRGF